VGVDVDVCVVACLVLELEVLSLVLVGGALLLDLGEAFAGALAFGVGGEGLESPLPKLHEPWRTPADSEPKKSNSPWEKSRLL